MSDKPIAEILVPTVSYGNIRFFVYEGTPEEIIEESRRLNQLQQGAFGLTEKEFNAFIDEYLASGTVKGEHVHEQYEKMSTEQKLIIQAIKRSCKRIAYKIGAESKNLINQF